MSQMKKNFSSIDSTAINKSPSAETVSIQKKLTEDAIRLKKAREKSGLKQKDFARFIGSSVKTISNIENGHRKLSPAMKEKIKQFEENHDLSYEQMFSISVNKLLERHGLHNTFINHDIIDNLYKLLDPANLTLKKADIERYENFLKNMTECMLAFQLEEFQALEENRPFKRTSPVQLAYDSVRARDQFFYNAKHQKK